MMLENLEKENGTFIFLSDYANFLAEGDFRKTTSQAMKKLSFCYLKTEAETCNSSE